MCVWETNSSLIYYVKVIFGAIIDCNESLYARLEYSMGPIAAEDFS